MPEATLQVIADSENVGDSLAKINENFVLAYSSATGAQATATVAAASAIALDGRLDAVEQDLSTLEEDLNNIQSDVADLNVFTAEGDLMYAGPSAVPAALPKATDGWMLTQAAGIPSWIETRFTAARTLTIPAGSTYAEIVALIAATVKNLNGNSLVVQFEDGEYTMTGSLTFLNFYGGAVTIQGNTTEADATALHTAQAVHLNFSTWAGGSGCILCRNLMQPTIRNLKITMPDAVNTCGIQMEQMGIAIANYNYIVSAGKTTVNSAIQFSNGGCGSVSSNYVSNTHYGIRAIRTLLTSTNNDDTGTAPNYGLRAENPAFIYKSGTQPAGTTAAESAIAPGAIA